MRLTITRAVRGLASPTMARARSSRPLPLVNGRDSLDNTLRKRRGTTGPRFAGLPAHLQRDILGSGAIFQTGPVRAVGQHMQARFHDARDHRFAEVRHRPQFRGFVAQGRDGRLWSFLFAKCGYLLFEDLQTCASRSDLLIEVRR
jgi:hypothetical protein